MSMTNRHPLKSRIDASSYTQERVALELGIDPGLFSRYLRGLRPMPDGFASRVHKLLDRLELADAAAEEARQRVLAQEEAHDV